MINLPLSVPSSARPVNIDDILNKLSHVKKMADGWQADCPCSGHDTPAKHLHVKDGGDKALATCFHLHDYGQICQALGFESLTYAKDTPPAPIKPAELGPVVATYDYTDASGKLLYQVTRHQPKDFRQRRPDGMGGWIRNLEGVTPVLFMLPEVIRCVDLGETLYIVEGEKDALSCWNTLAVPATCNSGGAGKWRPEFAEILKGGHVTVIPDNDAPGRAHAKTILESLYGKARSLKVLEIPEAKDVTEWIEAGNCWQEFDDILIPSAIDYVPGRWPKPTLAVRGINL